MDFTTKKTEVFKVNKEYNSLSDYRKLRALNSLIKWAVKEREVLKSKIGN